MGEVWVIRICSTILLAAVLVMVLGAFGVIGHG